MLLDGPAVAPEAVFEVRSPTDRWREILAKVADYLAAGVIVVWVLDPPCESIHVYRAEEPTRVLTAKQALALPDVLPGFSVVARRLFE